MLKFAAPVALGFALIASPAFSVTPEIVNINGVTATRISVAPPQSPLASTIKSGLKASYRNSKPSSRAFKDAEQLYFFYGARGFEPLWLSQDVSGKIAFSKNAQKIIDVFKTAHLTGLKPSDYLTDDIDLDIIGNNPEKLARLETAFSAAAMRYAQDTFSGRIKPSAVSRNFDVKSRPLNEAKTLMDLASTQDPQEYLLNLEPKHREFVALKAALAKFEAGEVDDTVVVPDGGILRPGKYDKRAAILRERLDLPPAIDNATYYDDTLVAAVEAFQSSLGLIVDGVVGPATVAALNGGSATSRADIVANMERWRWMPEELGEFMVHVNIPEFRLSIMDHGTPSYTTRVVTGKKANQTPIFSDEMEHIVVNPYWNVPSSILVNEIGPKLSPDPEYISRNNMELLSGGKVIDASAIDWSTNSVSNFRIRQRPGRGNALGSVKFLFPNKHAVYLHDTPSKSLFSRSFRAYSHGCVRVHNPWEFAEALLKRETTVKIASLEGQRGKNEKWNNLNSHIPVHITYFTLRVDETGMIRSYGDVYGHNAKLIALMEE